MEGDLGPGPPRRLPGQPGQQGRRGRLHVRRRGGHRGPGGPGQLATTVLLLVRAPGRREARRRRHGSGCSPAPAVEGGGGAGPPGVPPVDRLGRRRDRGQAAPVAGPALAGAGQLLLDAAAALARRPRPGLATAALGGAEPTGARAAAARAVAVRLRELRAHEHDGRG